MNFYILLYKMSYLLEDNWNFKMVLEEEEKLNTNKNKSHRHNY